MSLGDTVGPIASEDEEADLAARARGLEWMATSVRRTFVGRLDGLRGAVEAEQKIRAERRPPRAVVEAGETLSRSTRQQVMRLVDQFMQDAGRSLDESVRAAAEEPGGTTLLAPVGGEMAALAGFALVHPDSDAQSSALPTFLDDLQATGGESLPYALALLDWRASKLAPSALARAAFVGATTEFEVLLGSLLRIGGLRHPKALGILNRQFTVADYETVGGDPFLLRLAAAHEVVSEILMGSPPEWFKTIRRWPGIDVNSLVADPPATLELFARRNVLVHADGVVDARYLAATGSDVSIGTRLDPTTDETLAAIDLILALGEGLALLWVPKIEAGANLDATGASDAVYRQIERHRWATAQMLASRFLEEPVPDGDKPLRAVQINQWLAMREEAGSIEPIESSVRQWEFPADDPEWQLAVAALLDDPVMVVRVVDDARSRGDQLRNARRWPLIRLMSDRHESVRRSLRRPPAPRPRKPPHVKRG